MPGFTKLFSSIVTSSIWVLDDATLRVWFAMLAMADANGRVEGSVPGFASLARVSIEQMEAVIETLSSVDKHSRTPDHGGRRIEAIPGGWILLNYAAYREKGQAQTGSRAPYFRDYRKKQKELLRNSSSQQKLLSDTQKQKQKQKQKKEQPTPPPTSGVPGGCGKKSRTNLAPSQCAERFIQAFNASFKRNLTALPPLVADIEKHLKAGYNDRQLLALPIVTDARALPREIFADKSRFKKFEPRWLLRTGDKPHTSSNGATVGGYDWMGAALNNIAGTVLQPRHRKIAEELGVMDFLVVQGASVAPEEDS